MNRRALAPDFRRRRLLRALLTALGLLALAGPLTAARAEPEAKEIFGWAERVIIRPGTIRLRAKLDTGADTSSLDATHIRRFRRGGDRFVRFTIEDPETQEQLTLEKPLLRRVTIKRHDGEHQRRSVVTIDLCLGGYYLDDVEVSLIDRSEFNFPLLLGRSALEGIAIVDPELTFTQAPSCALEPGG